ncbi:hypothetical protein HG531_009082 [Fusarium graminearum]|nr:hypothetical protein HG531_009082 [Fusarium graminearum]
MNHLSSLCNFLCIGKSISLKLGIPLEGSDLDSFTGRIVAIKGLLLVRGNASGEQLRKGATLVIAVGVVIVLILGIVVLAIADDWIDSKFHEACVGS